MRDGVDSMVRSLVELEQGAVPLFGVAENASEQLFAATGDLATALSAHIESPWSLDAVLAGAHSTRCGCRRDCFMNNVVNLLPGTLSAALDRNLESAYAGQAG